MAAKLKALKTPTTSGTTEVEALDLKISEGIKKVNTLRHEVQRKQADLDGILVTP